MGKILATAEKHWKIIALIVLTVILGVDQAGEIIGGFNGAETVTEATGAVLTELLDDSLDKKLDEKLAPFSSKFEGLESTVTGLQTTVTNLKDALSSEPDYVVIVLELELNKLSKPEEVDDMVDRWIGAGWTAQEGMCKYIMENDSARSQLEKAIIYPEVFRRFLLRARQIP